MNVVLWILQVLLAVFFVFHSVLMLRPSPERLQSGMKYILEMPSALRLFSAIAEGLAGLALVLPALFKVASWLTPLAALGLVVLMLGAVVFHLMRREYPNIALNTFLGVLAAVVVWGRFGPIRSRRVYPVVQGGCRWVSGNLIRITCRWSSPPSISA